MRPSKDSVFLKMAYDLSELATCANRSVGCLLVDKRHRIVSSGYNGPAPKSLHCTEVPCPGAHYTREEDKILCEAIHAEQNAIIQCRRPDEIYTCYTTHSPCIQCIKMLAITGAERVVFYYPSADRQSQRYWQGLGREWVQLLRPEDLPHD